MAASPIFQVELQVGAARWWRSSVLVLVLTAGAAVGAWWWFTAPDLRSRLAALLAVAGLGGTLAGLSLLRVRSARLLHDGGGWQLAWRAEAPEPVDLDVALDLGPWMLLRAAGRGRRVRWLPLDARGLGTAWAALRRAVYSPRPAGGLPAAPDRPDPLHEFTRR